MALNFSDALNTKTSEIERPPLLPIGHYIAIVEKMPSFDTIADGRFDVVDFILKIQSAGDDIDPDDIEEYGDVTAARVRHRFLFNKEEQANFNQTLYNLKRFLQEHLLIDMNDDTPLKESLNNALNQQCLIAIKWRADRNDAEIQYAEVARTAPVE